MMTSRVRSLALFMSVSAGTALGAFTLAAGLSDDGPLDSSSADGKTVLVDTPALMPASTGSEPQVFDGEVSAVAATAGNSALREGAVRVSFQTGATPSDICFEIVIGDEEMAGCALLADVRTGIVYVASQSHGGSVEIVGIVPDDASVVMIDHTSIIVENNLWHYSGTAGDYLGFTVLSSDGSKRATLG